MLEELQSDFTDIGDNAASLHQRLSALESARNWYAEALASPYCIANCSYRDQADIDRRTVKLSNNPSGTNESLIYDQLVDGCKIILATSLPLYNRVNLALPRIKTGEVVFQWEYMPSADWLGNGGVVTHKMFMIATNSRSDNRLLEQRFHYESIYRPQWRCDTRDYGAASGGESLATSSQSFVRMNQWIRFESRVNFLPAIPEYSVKIMQGDTVIQMYDRFLLDTFHAGNYSIDYFSPTWANTSHRTLQPARLHGWLRNAVVLWNPTGEI
jgi:hypothetical protein